MSKQFRYYLRVRYNECDAQKVVFNARYGDYVDLAVTEFFRALTFEQGLTPEEFDYQVVKLTIEWRAPAQFRQVLELSTHVSDIGNTSFTINVSMRIAGGKEIVARAEMIGVAVDPFTLKKVPMSSEMREAMRRGAPGAWVDHAGYSNQLAGKNLDLRSQ